jgi:hypothetical protein
MRNNDNLELKSVALFTLTLLVGLLIISLAGCAATTETRIHTNGHTYSAASGIGLKLDDTKND